MSQLQQNLTHLTNKLNSICKNNKNYDILNQNIINYISYQCKYNPKVSKVFDNGWQWNIFYSDTLNHEYIDICVIGGGAGCGKININLYLINLDLLKVYVGIYNYSRTLSRIVIFGDKLITEEDWLIEDIVN